MTPRRMVTRRRRSRANTRIKPTGKTHARIVEFLNHEAQGEGGEVMTPTKALQVFESLGGYLWSDLPEEERIALAKAIAVLNPLKAKALRGKS